MNSQGYYIQPHYVAASQNGWGVEMIGSDAVDGCKLLNHAGIIGLPMLNFTVEASGIKKARVKNSRGQWLDYKDKFDKFAGLGDGTEITGLEIVGSGYRIDIHLLGLTYITGLETSDDEGVVLADFDRVIDAIRIVKI